jgi:hypothetical protein
MSWELNLLNNKMTKNIDFIKNKDLVYLVLDKAGFILTNVTNFELGIEFIE